MKDGRTHLAHKAEHAVDLETGAIVGVTVQDADDGDTTTSIETLIEAAEQVEAVRARRRGRAGGRRRQGLSQQSVAGGSRSRRRPQLHLGTGSRPTELEEATRRRATPCIAIVGAFAARGANGCCDCEANAWNARLRISMRPAGCVACTAARGLSQAPHALATC